MTEEEIIIAYKSGHADKAFRGIVECYTERLFWHIRRLVVSHEDADDLLQETFVKIWEGLPEFRSESGLFTWCYRIATNETLNFLRKQKIRSALRFKSIDDEMERKIEADPYFNGTKAQRALQIAISHLPEKQRIVFTMRYFDDIKYEDLSEILDTSVGALKASYHIARAKVVEEMKAQL